MRGVASLATAHGSTESPASARPPSAIAAEVSPASAPHAVSNPSRNAGDPVAPPVPGSAFSFSGAELRVERTLNPPHSPLSVASSIESTARPASDATDAEPPDTSNHACAHAVCGCEGPRSGLFAAYVQARWKNEAHPPPRATSFLRAEDILNRSTPRFASAALVSAEASRQRRAASAEATSRVRRSILRFLWDVSSNVGEAGEPRECKKVASAFKASASRAAARARAAPSATALSNLCAASSKRPWCEYIKPSLVRISPGSEAAQRGARRRRRRRPGFVKKKRASRAAGGTAAADAAASSAACRSTSACDEPFARARDQAMDARCDAERGCAKTRFTFERNVSETE